MKQQIGDGPVEKPDGRSCIEWAEANNSSRI
jgi:hypothetical protein